MSRHARGRGHSRCGGWWSGCLSKLRYASHEQAKVARRKCETRRPDSHLRIYECPRCHGWHLTATAPAIQPPLEKAATEAAGGAL